ncbi:hypothetical protein K1T71_005605 [Dendrolimus kikuchii]|uniref:Uncharacterized protein n=1 Tax=Dendrolimus kikuchii TaxID=765133 RepID=A0ACC1D4P0_9NEOP|nr:hypothetical protein K1T71_005605 [Dendrolimus kikuchii]
MNQLAQEVQRSSALQQKLKDMESLNQLKDEELLKMSHINICEFGSWISENEDDIDLCNYKQIENLVQKAHDLHEGQLKGGLQYFHNKFKLLFDKLTSITIKAIDDRNKWSLQEENYKAEIQNLQAQIEEEDFSDKSPGLLTNLNLSSVLKKCRYLEESYKYIRTLNENMKNDDMENKKEALMVAAEYESQIQRHILAVTNLTGMLRSSIPITYFWKQNEELNEIASKYRKCLENDISKQAQSFQLNKYWEINKGQIISAFESILSQNGNISSEEIKKTIEDIVRSSFQKKFEELSSQLTIQNNNIKILEEKNKLIQDNQSRLIDDSLSSLTNKEIELMKEQLKKLADDNKIYKEQCQHVNGQLENVLLQLQNAQRKQLNYDMEINMLKHQILDLQSTSDSKAIIARLSGEVLVAHLQASESHQKLENLNLALNKEKERRIETEDMLESRQKIFDVYAFRYDKKFRYMYEVMQILRKQYQGSIPLLSIENYLTSIEDLNRNTYAVDEKLVEVENLRFSLMAKHSTFDQILEVTKKKCFLNENTCSHQLKCKMMETMHSREMDFFKNKLEIMENTRKALIKQCNQLERSIVLLNQAFDKSNSPKTTNSLKTDANGLLIKLEDIQSDDEQLSRKSATITLPKPQILKPSGDNQKIDETAVSKEDVATETLIESPIKTQPNVKIVKFSNVQIQTVSFDKHIKHQFIQTDFGDEVAQLKLSLNRIQNEHEIISKELEEAVILLEQKTKEVRILDAEKSSLQNKVKSLKTTFGQKNDLIEKLEGTIEGIKDELLNLRSKNVAEKCNRDNFNENNKSLLSTLKQLEADKNTIAHEYKELLNNERNEYSKSLKDLNIKIMELQTKLDRKGSDDNASNSEAFKDHISKYTIKIAELEDKCFRLQSDLDECKSESKMYQGEADRWKDLAMERLTKMEQLNSQLEERHCHEVESYKAENQHWLTQLGETQREHMELRSRLTEQKAAYVKQLAEKDTQIEQLRTIIHNLKAQIMNMQTMLSANDPSFDLSAIVELDEESDALSPQGSDRLELKFDSNHDLYDSQDDFLRLPGSSTTIWQEPIIERLRRDKQLTGKQNAILRRQIKALAARERRARLDAQNLKNQLFRISTTGNKVATAETTALHNKITTLQAQLMNIRRDSQSSVALWDKWKRAQQATDRWQARYEDKCQEIKKLESSLNLAKSSITRLEREKRVLMSRITEIKCESQLTLEKQEAESSEKKQRVTKECNYDDSPVSSQALIERVKSQQRRIVALEAAEKGNEHLVSEYEKSLAEITSLKGQVLKLESTVLESQIRSPLKTNKDTQPELDYWKSYCEMLKEENVQLTLKLNSLETTPATTHQQRINDLEQTVLTLRGLVSKLQAEQKSFGGHKRSDSRPSSGRAAADKNVSQLESHRIEIANLKRSLQDKDLLLERSKEMLKIAAEREDELLRENALLRRRIDMLSETSGGFLSA